MKSFSLSLGGGAARWLAHIGVIRKFEELWVIPIAISGTSMGAIIATFYALGFTSTEMEEIVCKKLKLHTLIDFDLKNGVIRGKKIVKFLEEYIGSRQFSDTKIPLTLIATDIDSGEKNVFNTWSIIDALRASISVPGLFSPHKYSGKNLVDGGLTANLPIEDLPPGNVIAVTVQIPMSEKKKRQKKFTLFPDGTLFSNSYLILRKTIGIMIAQNEARSMQSREKLLVIQPWRHELDYYDFSQKKLLIQAWYEVSEHVKEFLNL